MKKLNKIILLIIGILIIFLLSLIFKPLILVIIPLYVLMYVFIFRPFIKKKDESVLRGGEVGIITNYFALILMMIKWHIVESNKFLLYLGNIIHTFPVTVTSKLNICYAESCVPVILFSYIFWIPFIGFLIGGLIGYLIKKDKR